MVPKHPIYGNFIKSIIHDDIYMGCVPGNWYIYTGVWISLGSTNITFIHKDSNCS